MQQRKNRALLILGLVIAFAAIGVLAWHAYGSASLSSRFGQAELQLTDGSRLYVKRESWGLHTQRLALSQNPDPCVPADPKTDFIDDDSDALVYSTEGETLRVYQMLPPFSFRAPEMWQGKRPDFVNAGDWWSIYHNPKQVGAVALDVPLNAFCLIHLWRPVSSLRPR